MANKEQTLSYEVRFNDPRLNATYTFYRCESGAFDYGNKSMVCVERNKKHLTTIDTRYDKLVMKDFRAWCEEFLSSAFNPDYEPTWEEVK